MFKRYIKKYNLGSVKKEYFKNITTMKVGGKIKYLYYPNSISSLKKAIEYINNKEIEYIFMGNGSNIIASERKFKGVVISSKFLPKTLSIDKNQIRVTAFYDLRRLVSFCVSRDIDTFTNLAGIPATLGGAIYMNASANNQSISDHLVTVTYLIDNQIITKTKKELEFSYRTSEFQKNKAIILEAKFEIINKKNILVNYNNYLTIRKNNHPIIFPNSGSIFRNTKDKKAYEIIKELNLDGYTKGKAQVSMKHCNFIINIGDAKAEDIYKIINYIKKRAYINNYILQEEVILFNFKEK